MSYMDLSLLSRWEDGLDCAEASSSDDKSPSRSGCQRCRVRSSHWISATSCWKHDTRHAFTSLNHHPDTEYNFDCNQLFTKPIVVHQALPQMAVLITLRLHGKPGGLERSVTQHSHCHPHRDLHKPDDGEWEVADDAVRRVEGGADDVRAGDEQDEEVVSLEED
mmetsp:Transcript_36495/g.73214  ORF Transcript_36495/g.73214 Transcript_36495/m.73214 type:complete len:164 (+) Transcript_36495:687-1178(+)